MSDESPTDRLQRVLARVSEQVSIEATESDVQRRRLEEESDEVLTRVARDRERESAVARTTALRILVDRHQRDRSLSALICELMGDPDAPVAEQAIRSSQPFDAQATAKLHALLDEPHAERWSLAASTLARRKDQRILPRLLQWLKQGDRAHFLAALSGLRWFLPEDQFHELLGTLWERDDRDEEEDRLTLATMLLEFDDETGLPWLVEVANGHGPRSIPAVDAVFQRESIGGLESMAAILDQAEPDVRRRLAERISERAERLDRQTNDPVAEARAWVERRLREESGAG